MFINFNIVLCILICVCPDLFFGFKCVNFQIFSYCLGLRSSGTLLNSNILSYINKSHNKFKPFGLKVKFGDEIKKIDFPIEREAPLKNVPIPPWAIEFTGKKEPEEPYVPKHFTQKEIESGIEEFNVETRKRSKTEHIQITDCGIKSYGFKFKQIQPVRHHNGKAFTFFYIHSLHTDVIPVLLNSLRRVAKRHLGSGRITALRIPGMENEFYSVVGLREDFFELVRNLRGVIFKNVPKTATFHRPVIATLRLKGPIIAVAGHLKFDNKRSTKTASDIDNKTENKNDNTDTKADNEEGVINDYVYDKKYTGEIEVINKNHYICSLSQGCYLTMDVKIEYISNYVIPEFGPESLNRDITPDGFIHFCSSCNPVEIFGFTGERRGLDEQSTSEIVSLELHTDGSATPRVALLRSATFLLNWFDRTLYALRTNLTRDYYALKKVNTFNTSQLIHNPELNRNLPWNPFLSPEERVAHRLKWFYRKDVKRQYAIDPESKMAKEEQLAEWNRVLEKHLSYERRIPPILSDDEADFENDILVKDFQEQKKRDENPPDWIFKDPAGVGNIGQQKILGADNEPGLIPEEQLDLYSRLE
ncbi:DNA-directed RNA polymerase D subunit, putative [Theileria annulata]|uniref:DNA-directed RNA polymerase D subunit, putative n=1 Tax=Theileria annulata TaxID=5874 RepID=Q4UCN2_THEAN|nr:DNA-directed RNA polymerase D subunit, putative [Theileria annulata]CAI75419.1 DNA-directed RNA polymerase D subunit, putative [Theileria annulata]|eukprot:XP_954895.1 DNA-directed RNA polymerase D subunit, putative [Theileria annulata]